MTYIFEVETGFEERVIIDAFGVYVVEFALGYDLDCNEVVLMSVMLVPGASYLRKSIQGVFDLKFGIRTRDLRYDWKVGEPDFTSDAVARYIRSDQRHIVLEELLRAVVFLVMNANPKNITMGTFYADLPEKALRKYERIVTTVETIGYETVDAFVGTDLRSYWHLRKCG